MRVEKSVVRNVANGTVEQELKYQVGEKIRREIFVGYDRDHLAAMVRERVKELEKL